MSDSAKTKRTLFKALAFVCLVGILTGCGNQLGSGGRPSNSSYSPFGPGSTSTQRGPGGSTQTRAPVGGTTVNTGYDRELQVCDQWRNGALSVINACGAIFQQNWEDLTSSCRARFQDLYNNDCSGISTRLQGVFNACSADISGAMQYLPANCQSALRQFVR
jgi:hypothetical protein